MGHYYQGFASEEAHALGVTFGRPEGVVADNHHDQATEQEESMSTAPIPSAAPPAAQPAAAPPVAYGQAARRHMSDAESLYNNNRHANAGQLYGFVAECGLKALLIACGVLPDADGGIPGAHPTQPHKPHPLRQHVPGLMDRITAHKQLIPDGPQATKYLATLSHLNNFKDWSIDHRYWHDAALPFASVAGWRTAANEVTRMIDQAKQDGVL